MDHKERRSLEEGLTAWAEKHGPVRENDNDNDALKNGGSEHGEEKHTSDDTLQEMEAQGGHGEDYESRLQNGEGVTLLRGVIGRKDSIQKELEISGLHRNGMGEWKRLYDLSQQIPGNILSYGGNEGHSKRHKKSGQEIADKLKEFDALEEILKDKIKKAPKVQPTEKAKGPTPLEEGQEVVLPKSLEPEDEKIAELETSIQKSKKVLMDTEDAPIRLERQQAIKEEGARIVVLQQEKMERLAREAEVRRKEEEKQTRIAEIDQLIAAKRQELSEINKLIQNPNPSILSKIVDRGVLEEGHIKRGDELEREIRELSNEKSNIEEGGGAVLHDESRPVEVKSELEDSRAENTVEENEVVPDEKEEAEGEQEQKQAEKGIEKNTDPISNAEWGNFVNGISIPPKKYIEIREKNMRGEKLSVREQAVLDKKNHSNIHTDQSETKKIGIEAEKVEREKDRVESELEIPPVPKTVKEHLEEIPLPRDLSNKRELKDLHKAIYKNEDKNVQRVLLKLVNEMRFDVNNPKNVNNPPHPVKWIAKDYYPKILQQFPTPKHLDEYFEGQKNALMEELASLGNSQSDELRKTSINFELGFFEESKGEGSNGYKKSIETFKEILYGERNVEWNRLKELQENEKFPQEQDTTDVGDRAQGIEEKAEADPTKSVTDIEQKQSSESTPEDDPIGKSVSVEDARERIDSLIEKGGTDMDAFKRAESRGSEYVTKQGRRLEARFNRLHGEAEQLIMDINKKISKKSPKLITWTKKGKARLVEVAQLEHQRREVELTDEKEGYMLGRQDLLFKRELYRGLLEKYGNDIPEDERMRIERLLVQNEEGIKEGSSLLYDATKRLNEHKAAQGKSTSLTP